MLKHLQKCFASNIFSKCFSVKHSQNILEVVTDRIDVKATFRVQISQQAHFSLPRSMAV